jgi:hypothetical protein
MINRKYIVSSKAAHNDNTGLYSHYSFVLNTVGFMPDTPDDILITARDLAFDGLKFESDSVKCTSQVEIVSISRW